MILVEGEKYACVQCIRGHRSSTCKHTKRPLVQVRSRGRPNSCSDHRVTVFAEDETKKDVLIQKPKTTTKFCCGDPKKPSSCCSPSEKELETSGPSTKSCCQSLAAEHQPVIMLKASRKQLYNVSKGSFALLDPVSSSSQQTTFPIKAHGGKCSCCKDNKKKNPKSIRSSSLRSSSSSSSMASLKTPASDTSFQPDNKNEYLLQFFKDQKNTPTVVAPSNLKLNPNVVYDLFYAGPCAVPGTCCCESDNCSCEGCSVHGNDKTSAGQMSNVISPNLSNNNINLITGQYSVSDLMKNIENFNAIPGFEDYDPMDDCSCLPEECACYNCPKHLIVDGIRLSDGIRVASPLYSGPAVPTTTIQNNVEPKQIQDNSQNRTTITNLLFNDFSTEETIDMMEDCQCPADSCHCVNCFKHGIFNNEFVNFETPLLQLVPKSGTPVGEGSSTTDVNSIQGL